MSRMPSIKRLEESFPGKGKELRNLLKLKTKTSHYESVRSMVKQSYNSPEYTEKLLTALNEILEGHGVEPIWGKDDESWPLADYVNMGDTYNATLLLDYTSGAIQITSMGDWVERNERKVKQ